mgnify:CR=1 FL=1
MIQIGKFITLFLMSHIRTVNYKKYHVKRRIKHSHDTTSLQLQNEKYHNIIIRLSINYRRNELQQSEQREIIENSCNK